MKLDLVQQRRQAHSLIDLLPAEKLATVRTLLESLSDPGSLALAKVPLDDESMSEEAIQKIEAAHASLARGERVTHEEVLADFGLTMQDFEEMANASAKVESKGH